MFVLIAGGGRTAAQLASLLIDQKHQVRVIENRREVLTPLHRELPTEAIYEGDAVQPDDLENAGIRQAEVLAACTPNDADNLVLCYLARTRYDVPRIIAQINNPRNAWLFDEKFHVDVALNQSEILASLIVEEMSLGDMMTLLKLRRGQFSVVEEKIPAGAKAIGVDIQNLGLPDQCVIAAIIRQGKMVVPRGATVMEAGDEVLAVTDRQGGDFLASLFAASDPPRGSSRSQAGSTVQNGTHDQKDDQGRQQ
jgi:trk system potassium uptake protein TrkA